MIDAARIQERLEECKFREVDTALRRLDIREVQYKVVETWQFLRRAGVVMEQRGYQIGVPDDPRNATPSMSERAGRHVMRESAIKWCRAHPVEAAALPSWDLDLLRRVLEGVA